MPIPYHLQLKHTLFFGYGLYDCFSSISLIFSQSLSRDGQKLELLGKPADLPLYKLGFPNHIGAAEA